MESSFSVLGPLADLLQRHTLIDLSIWVNKKVVGQSIERGITCALVQEHRTELFALDPLFQVRLNGECRLERDLLPAVSFEEIMSKDESESSLSYSPDGVRYQ